MGQQEQAVTAVVTLLTEHGWRAAGATRVETVRMPTQQSPVFGGMGGEVATFGGRLRFERDDRRVTVGKRTTCFYRMGADGACGFRNVPTKDIATVVELAK